MTKKVKNQVTAQFSNKDVEVQQAFQRLNAMLLTMSARVAEDVGFTLTEILVCEHLRLDGPLTPREVGERVGLSSGAVTRLLDRLESRGFTRRSPHPSDRRKLLMHYVEQAPETTERPLSLFNSLNEALGTFSDVEKETLVRFMETMTHAVEQDVQLKPE